MIYCQLFFYACKLRENNWKSYTFVALKILVTMNIIRLKDKEFELFISEDEIKQSISRIAKEIKSSLSVDNPLFVCVLNGAFMFSAELLRQLDEGYEVAFARYASYSGTSTTGRIREIMPLTIDVKGRSVILMEDIVDSGYTMQCVMNKLKEDGVKDIKLATLLFKPEALKCNLNPDFIGFSIPNDFIVGYGLDYDGFGRAYKDIYKVKETN